MKQQIVYLAVVLMTWCDSLFETSQVHAQNSNNTDITWLNYALSLEYLEHAFYRDGLAQFGYNNSGNQSNPVIARIEQIRDQEADHVAYLTETIARLGGTPVRECEFNFTFTDPAEFINVARAMENVGVSAYTGAFYHFNDSRLLTLFATIATVEARHAAYLNQASNVDPFPHAYDSPLDVVSDLTLASPWIISCPDTLIDEPRPWVEVDPFIVRHGETVNVTTQADLSGGNETYCVFYAGAKSNSTLLQSEETGGGGNTTNWWCRVPENDWIGDTYLFLSSNGTYDLMFPEPIIAGPGVVFLLE